MPTTQKVKTGKTKDRKFLVTINKYERFGGGETIKRRLKATTIHQLFEKLKLCTTLDYSLGMDDDEITVTNEEFTKRTEEDLLETLDTNMDGGDFITIEEFKGRKSVMLCGDMSVKDDDEENEW